MDAGLEEQQPPDGRLLGDARGDARRGLLRPAILDVLDRQHRAETTDVADRLEPLLPREHASADGFSDPLGSLEQPLLLEHIKHGHGGGERDGIAHVGAADRVVPERVHDLRLPEDSRERQTAGD